MSDQKFQPLADRGFTMDKNVDGYTDSFFFTAPIRDEDLRNVTEALKPDHWKPSFNYRSVFFGTCAWSGGGKGWYATSNIRGEFRGYRGRRVSRDYDAGNIFASGKTIEECVANFVKAYDALEYNRAAN